MARSPEPLTFETVRVLGLQLPDTEEGTESAPDRLNGGRWVGIWIRHGLVAEALSLKEESERTAAIRVRRPARSPLLVFGTVLPWRGDTRHAEYRGGRAFVRWLRAQVRDLG
jgi:hypothetical protein